MSGFFSPLERDAILHLTGPDALKFLQGQASCDTRKVDEEHAIPGAYCTPQGRVVCDFLLSQLGEEHYALRLRSDIRNSSAEVFGKYIVFSKAELDASRDDWTVIACWGEDAAASLTKIFGALPTKRYATVSQPGAVLVQIDEHGQAFECYLQQQEQPAAAQQLISAALEAATENDWEALQIKNGIARIEASTRGEFIPQMLNYDLTGHVSFDKGCYTGQEVVARMHYRGKPKRRLYCGKLAGTAAPGTTIYMKDSEQNVGTIVNSARLNDTTAVALLTATRAGVAAGLQLRADDHVTGMDITLGTLPYAVPSADD